MTPDDTTLARLVDTLADAVIVADAEGNWDGYRTVMASGHTRNVTDLLRFRQCTPMGNAARSRSRCRL